MYSMPNPVKDLDFRVAPILSTVSGTAPELLNASIKKDLGFHGSLEGSGPRASSLFQSYATTHYERIEKMFKKQSMFL